MGMRMGMGMGMGIGIPTRSPPLPLALPLAQVALRLLREGEGHTLAHCLRAEFRAAQRFMQHSGPQGHARSDFFEGIRAALVDKDKAPRWSPAALEHVSDAAVDEYFAPLGERELELPL